MLNIILEFIGYASLWLRIEIQSAMYRADPKYFTPLKNKCHRRTKEVARERMHRVGLSRRSIGRRSRTPKAVITMKSLRKEKYVGRRKTVPGTI